MVTDKSGCILVKSQKLLLLHPGFKLVSSLSEVHKETFLSA